MTQAPTVRRAGSSLTMLAAVVSASPAHAAVAGVPMLIPDSGDTGWMAAATLFGTTASIAGILRLASALHGRAAAPRITAGVAAALSIAALLFVAIGYSLAFSGSGSALLGSGSNWMLNLMGTVRDGTTIPETCFVAFQTGMALVAVTLLSALIAPRVRAGWLLLFVAIWFLFVLVPLSRWLWGGGWLAALGAIDIAGGLLIFLTAAASAATVLAMAGPVASTVAPDPVDDAMLPGGALLLLAGMIALAAGATLGASDGMAVAMLTMLTGALSAMLCAALLARRLDAATLAAGLVAGIAATATAGDGVSIGGAMLTGIVAALAMRMTSALAARLAPTPLQSGAGLLTLHIAGSAAAGALLFAMTLAFSPFGGTGYAEAMGPGRQLGAQLVAVCVVAGWSVAGTLIAATIAGLAIPRRLAADAE